MIYLDNSATSYPKPQCVLDGIIDAFKSYGANPGRSSYKMAIDTSEQIYNCRKIIADYFHMDFAENVIFTHNCTTALNFAIKGLAKKGSHFIISNLEHNAVVRPLESLKKSGICEYSIAEIDEDIYCTLKNFERKIKDNTVAIICTGASNAFGVIPPYKSLASLAHKYNKLFILDYSQIAGVVPLDLKKTNIDIVCCSGHKCLLGPTGTGLLLINNDIVLNTILEGGTGSNSWDLSQPNYYPDRLESGTQNIVGIIGLSKAVEYLKKYQRYSIYNHEIKLMKYFYSNMKYFKNVIFYTDIMNDNKLYAPIISFNVKNMHSEEVAHKLSEFDIAVRAGLHCAPLAHKTYKTDKTGTVRISPSLFTKKSDIDLLINSLRKIAK